jgi:hypothetical protein
MSHLLFFFTCRGKKWKTKRCFHPNAFLEAPVIDAGEERTFPLAGERFEWERSNPTGFPGKVGLDEVLRRYFLLSTEYNPRSV